MQQTNYKILTLHPKTLNPEKQLRQILLQNQKAIETIEHIQLRWFQNKKPKDMHKYHLEEPLRRIQNSPPVHKRTIGFLLHLYDCELKKLQQEALVLKCS